MDGLQVEDMAVAVGRARPARRSPHGRLLLDPGGPPTPFHFLSFEGPDPYARAGGVASRVCGLAQTLADLGYETHLWFVGDPDLPGEERRGRLHLHRWCQWISRHHPLGVYDGEEPKREDYARSLPPHLFGLLLERLALGGQAVVMAEEWHTVPALSGLDTRLREAGRRERVHIQWNANNLFGFGRIDWPELARAATITTVSRYMKHRMWPLGVDPVAIPNGLPADAFQRPDPQAAAAFRERLAGRLVLAKVARWDPDKRWIDAVEAVAELRARGLRPLFIARGGIEAHGAEVHRRARELGLAWEARPVALGAPGTSGAAGLLEALRDPESIDVLELSSFVDAEARRLLLSASDAVLANSGHEPFGLVGLETMAVGGLACTGCTGEEYAHAGRDALVLQSAGAGELVAALCKLRADPEREQALRRAGRASARRYTWRRVALEHLLPRVELAGILPRRAQGHRRAQLGVR
jgi:glycosyltransferase involved in cell wall biosynthesis